MRPIANIPALVQAFVFWLAAAVGTVIPVDPLAAQPVVPPGRALGDARAMAYPSAAAFSAPPRVGGARGAAARATGSALFAPLFSGSLIKTVTDLNGGNVMPGDVLEYVITATNSGPHDALYSILYDTIPANTTYQSNTLRILTGPNAGAKTDATNDDQAQYDVGQRRVRFRLGVGATGGKNGTIVPGASTSLRFRVTINAGTAPGTVISNIGTITFTDTVDQQFEIHQQSLPMGGLVTGEPTDITVTVPDLTIAKSHGGSFTRGQTGVYTLAISNAGNASTTAAISVSDVLPAGLTPTAASGTNWSCTIVAQTVSCTNPGPVAAGATLAPISLAVNVAANAPASLTNTATASGEGRRTRGTTAHLTPPRSSTRRSTSRSPKRNRQHRSPSGAT